MALKSCYCHTPGCQNDGVAFVWDDSPLVDEAEGLVVEQDRPWCGGCSTQYTDIKDAPPIDLDRPETLTAEDTPPEEAGDQP